MLTASDPVVRHVLRRLMPARLRPTARGLYARRRRVGFVAFAAALAVALGAAVAAGSWIAALSVVLVPLAGAALAMYRLRRRNVELAYRHNEMSRAVGALAIVHFGQTATPGATEVPLELVPHMVGSLVERGDVLDAYALLTRRSMAPVALDLPVRRRLWQGLQARGYLRAALEVAHACVADPAGRHHRTAYEKLKGEVAVLTGTPSRVARIARPARFAPVVGRVLHLVGTSLPTAQAGYAIRTHYTAMAQAAAGLDPHVVTQMGYATDRFTRSRENIDGVVYHRVPGPPRGSMPLDQWLSRHTERTAALVAGLRPAVLHAASDYLNAVTARALGDAFGLPVVYESRGFWEETWLSRHAQTFGWDLARLVAAHGLPEAYLWRREIEDRCRREADRVVTLAEVMADRIEAGGVDRARVTVVPNGVDVDAFPVLSRNRELARRLGIEDGTVVVGYISSIVEYEGIDTLIEAYGALKATASAPLALLIVGDGAELQALKRQAAGLGLADAIFTGRVAHDRVLDYYSLIDIFVVPRKPVEVCHLVTPLKPFEALATGRTLVMSNVRALAAIADQSQAAELFEAGSQESLAKTLTALLEDDPRRARLASAGAEWVRGNRTWTANAVTYRRLYAELGAAAPPVAASVAATVAPKGVATGATHDAGR
jgi:glycosyltransferase involved in cell wall biosynthesis